MTRNTLFAGGIACAMFIAALVTWERNQLRWHDLEVCDRVAHDIASCVYYRSHNRKLMVRAEAWMKGGYEE